MNDIVYQSIDTYKGELFEFEIRDSSTNDETKNVVESYNKLGRKNIKYYHYDSKFSLDEKCKIAIENNPYDYFMLLGDGNLYNFNELDEQLKINDYKKYNVVNLEPIYRKQFNKDYNAILNVVIEYDDPIKFSKYYSHLTYFGGAIYKTDFIKGAFAKEYYKACREDNISWWIVVCIFNRLIELKKENKSTLCAMLYVDGLNGNVKKTDHSWADKEKYFIITFKLFNKDLNELYDEYNGIKKDIVKTFRDDALATRRYLLYKRLNKDIDLKLVRKYKKDIKYVKGYYGYMVALSLTPVFILKFLRKLYKLIKQKNKV